MMVQVQSTWFPLYDINPQTFVSNIFTCDESAFVKATHRVYCGDHVEGEVSAGQDSAESALEFLVL